ncbi:histone deacetylase complex subunit SAP30L-like isoform X2 [Rhopilema esculentum]|uniref:histone deacetylase complex subunit SAP30L-like isoform X2 n=1 Tax=Rhopilema esculentum TaxID=499914 RepID=UPI0031D910C5
MLKSSNSREQEKESGRNGDLYCCLLEDREKCRRWAGNASFNFRVQKLVKQKKLGLTLNPDCKHTYICDNHKNVIQRARNKRKKSPHSEDENESADMVDFSSLQISTLRRYRRHFKLQNKAGMNKSQLLETISRHFKSIPVPEKETITYFIYMVKTHKSKLDQRPHDTA